MKKTIFAIAGVAVLIATFIGCEMARVLNDTQQMPEPAQADTIVVGLLNWPAASAKAHIIKTVLEDNFAVEVVLQESTNEAVFAGMDSGEMHVHPAVWLPNQAQLHQKYVTEAGTVRQATTSYYLTQHICVTKASAERTGIVKLSELAEPEIAGQFDSDGNGKGEMWIGATDWQSTRIEKIRAKSYGYNQTMQLKELDEAVALAELDDAVKNDRNIVFYCYNPHYSFQQHELVVLEEEPHDATQWHIVLPDEDANWLENSEALTAWDSTRVYVYHAAALETSHPAVAQMLQRVTFSSDAVSQINYALVVDKTPVAELARDWVREHAAEVDAWLR